MNKYINYLRQCNVMLREASKKSGISTIMLWFDYLWCVLRHRTLIKQYVYSDYWNLSGHVRRNGLTYARLVRLMNSYTDKNKVYILRDKWIFNDYFKEYVHHDWIHIADSTFEQFAAFANKHDRLFIKPAEGQDGEGIRLFTQSECPEVELRDLYKTLQDENAMVEEVIVQNPAMAFGTKSVNTIKVTTAADCNGNVKIMKSMLRIGIGDSVIDNLAAGGAIYDIDIEGGFVSTYGYGKHGEKYVYHPGTQNVVLGFKIPNWEEVKKCAIEAHKKLSSIQIIGWDIAITRDGVDLIEGNHNPDYLPIEYGTTGYYKKFKVFLGNKSK